MALANNRTTVCDLPVDALTMAQSIQRAHQILISGQPAQHVVLNAAKIVAAHSDPGLAKILREADLINADGQAVVWASRILGNPVPERVTGIDFMTNLIELATAERYPVFLLGAESEVVTHVAEQMIDAGVPISGFHHGYWRQEDLPSLLDGIRQAGTRILLVAIPSPQKERFLSEHLAQLGGVLGVGVGGAFDVMAGRTRRAPKVLQSLGLEWAFRLAQEPRRMFKRYLFGNVRFVRLVFRYRFSTRRISEIS